jgi:hypothetical protein
MRIAPMPALKQAGQDARRNKWSASALLQAQDAAGPLGGPYLLDRPRAMA